MEPFETIKYKGCTIELHSDEDPENPRTSWDNAGVMWCAHRPYDLGDEQFRTREPIDEKVKEIEKEGGEWLPLYLYDHTGITMNTTGFHCPWDSGQVGIIFITRAKILKEWCKGNRITKQRRAKVRDYLRGEVQTYDDYLTGQVAGFIARGPAEVDEDGEEITEGEEIDSCWGFYPDHETGKEDYAYMISEAKCSIDLYLKKKEEKK